MKIFIGGICFVLEGLPPKLLNELYMERISDMYGYSDYVSDEYIVRFQSSVNFKVSAPLIKHSSEKIFYNFGIFSIVICKNLSVIEIKTSAEKFTLDYFILSFRATVALVSVLNGMLPLHSSAVFSKKLGKAYLFMGKSGAGKTTALGLLSTEMNNVPLNDEFNIIKIGNNKLSIFPTPFSPQIKIRKIPNSEFELYCLFHLKKFTDFKIEPYSVVKQYSSLFTSLYALPVSNLFTELEKLIFLLIEQIVKIVAVEQLFFRKDLDLNHFLENNHAMEKKM